MKKKMNSSKVFIHKRFLDFHLLQVNVHKLYIYISGNRTKIGLNHHCVPFVNLLHLDLTTHNVSHFKKQFIL